MMAKAVSLADVTQHQTINPVSFTRAQRSFLHIAILQYCSINRPYPSASLRHAPQASFQAPLGKSGCRPDRHPQAGRDAKAGRSVVLTHCNIAILINQLPFPIRRLPPCTLHRYCDLIRMIRPQQQSNRATGIKVSDLFINLK
jgi:hypothetical protein